jgi:hypothetical protein
MLLPCSGDGEGISITTMSLSGLLMGATDNAVAKNKDVK